MAVIGIRKGTIPPLPKRVNPWWGRLGVLIIIGGALAAACRDGGTPAPQGTPGGVVPAISEEEYQRLVAVETPAAEESAPGGEGEGSEYRRSGYLKGPGDADRFELVAQHNHVDVTYTWPRGGTDFWVRIYGQTMNELGNFDLDDGDVIELTGGGKFTLEIYSRQGAGNWAATYKD
jgi:hypothetical protein